MQSKAVDKDILVSTTMIKRAHCEVKDLVSVKYTEKRVGAHHVATEVLTTATAPSPGGKRAGSVATAAPSASGTSPSPPAAPSPEPTPPATTSPQTARPSSPQIPPTLIADRSIDAASAASESNSGDEEEEENEQKEKEPPSRVPKQLLEKLEKTIELLNDPKSVNNLLKEVAQICDKHVDASRSDVVVAPTASPAEAPVEVNNEAKEEEAVDPVGLVLQRLEETFDKPASPYSRNAIKQMLDITNGDVEMAADMISTSDKKKPAKKPSPKPSAPPASPVDVKTIQDFLSIDEAEASMRLKRHGSVAKVMEAVYDTAPSSSSSSSPPPAGSPTYSSTAPPSGPRRAPDGAWAAGPPPNVPKLANKGPPRHLFIVRHGQREDDPVVDIKKEWESPTKARAYDCGLTRLGQQQSVDVGRFIHKTLRESQTGNMLETMVVSSPYKRCLGTAVSISEEVGSIISVMTQLGETYPKGKRVCCASNGAIFFPFYFCLISFYL